MPRNGVRHFTLVVDGTDGATLRHAWSDLCQPPGDKRITPEFLDIYPHMTTLQGNRFRFRGGDSDQLRESMQRLLQDRLKGNRVKVTVEA